MAGVLAATVLLRAAVLLVAELAQLRAEADVEMEAELGKEARLPCNIQPSDPSDEAHLVIWFKEGLSPAVYSFDARGGGAEEKIVPGLLEGRAFFRHRDQPASLAISGLRRSDQGNYTCRVDFRRSPTRKTRVLLSVIEPPEKLVLKDEQGSYVLGNMSHPYDEGVTAIITCICQGGQPVPQVTWWQDGVLVDESWHEVSPGRTENTLTLERLERRQFMSELTCRASNSHRLMPLSRTLYLDMNLRPVRARLVGDRRPLAAGKRTILQCVVEGSRPEPTLSWLLAGRNLTSFRVHTDSGSNITSSTLYLTPTADDSGKVLTCRADNSLVANGTVEAKWMLDVHHVPVAKLKIGGDDEREDVLEGSDVHFDCSVKSNPWVNRVIWKHNGRRLYNNSTMGVVVANQSLILHTVTWDRDGAYVCVAENEEGHGESNIVHLNIKHAPVCQSTEPQVVGLSQHHTTRIECLVSTNPKDVSFTWMWGDTGENLEPSFISDSHSSVLLPPGTSMARRTIQCRAMNEVGTQKKPCVFLLVPAVPPNPPRNCTVMEQTVQNMKVECTAWLSSSIPQTFTMDVFTQDSGYMIASVTADTPSFAVSGINGDVGLNISVYAFNSEGSSEAVTLLVPPVSAIQDTWAAASIACYLAPVFGSLVIVVLVLGSAMVVVTLLQQTQGRSRDGELDHCSGRPTCPTIFGTPEDEFCSIPLDDDGDSPTEIEPDVIPYKWGAYSQLAGSRQ